MADTATVIMVALLVLAISAGPFAYGLYLTLKHHKKGTSMA
ncbi:hypothetical protein [Thermococcus aggregans]|nr:hypothetical protein [Thermococcus aggregans]